MDKKLMEKLGKIYKGDNEKSAMVAALTVAPEEAEDEMNLMDYVEEMKPLLEKTDMKEAFAFLRSVLDLIEAKQLQDSTPIEIPTAEEVVL